MTTTTFDLLAAPACCRSAFFDGFTYGRAEGLSEGYRRGYAAADDEISALQRAAARIAHKAACWPVRDLAADRAAAEKRAAYWAARRGEGSE